MKHQAVWIVIWNTSTESSRRYARHEGRQETISVPWRLWITDLDFEMADSQLYHNSCSSLFTLTLNLTRQGLRNIQSVIVILQDRRDWIAVIYIDDRRGVRDNIFTETPWADEACLRWHAVGWSTRLSLSRKGQRTFILFSVENEQILDRFYHLCRCHCSKSSQISSPIRLIRSSYTLTIRTGGMKRNSFPPVAYASSVSMIIDSLYWTPSMHWILGPAISCWFPNYRYRTVTNWNLGSMSNTGNLVMTDSNGDSRSTLPFVLVVPEIPEHWLSYWLRESHRTNKRFSNLCL